MLEDSINFVLGNIVEVSVLIIIGFVLGALIFLFYGRTQIKRRESNISGLEASINEKDADLNKTRSRAQELLNKSAKEIERLSNQLKTNETILSEKEKRSEILNSQLGLRENNINTLTEQIKKRDESINLLKKKITELEETNRDLETHVEGTESRITEMENKAFNLDKINKDSIARIKEADNRVKELEQSLQYMEKNATSLKNRMSVMQDDFTCIVGIGPKMSSVLRSAGIDTFEKLASTDKKNIMEILEANNPSLLRLTDPSTWPEQAKYALNGNWDALSSLQQTIKKRKKS